MSLVNAFWVKVNGELRIKAKFDTGEWRLIKPTIKPYFFIREADLPQAEKILRSVPVEIERGDYVTVKKEPCVKVVVNFPNEVKTLREKLKAKGIPSYEADVPFVRRWMIDEGIKCSRHPKVLYFDIEADSREGIYIPESGEPPKGRLLSIACVDEEGREFFICEDDEREIYEQFKKLMEQYDLLVGYNNLRWDNPYLEERAKVIGVSYDPKIVRWQDMMLLYNKSFGGGYVSLRLDEVAKRELGIGKKLELVDLPKGGAEALWHFFKHDREKLREYNMWDAVLLKLLNEKTGCLDIAIEMAHMSYCLYEDALFNSRIIDGLLLRRSLEKTPRIVYQNKYGMAYKYGTYARGEEKKKVDPYRGGLVIGPKPGLYRDVINLDFQSLYPRIIRTFNIGVETVDDNGEILTAKKRFVKTPRSIFAEFLQDLDEERTYYKKLLAQLSPDDPMYKVYNVKQYELKILLNAVSGVVGAYGFRFYDRDVAESITLTGRELLKMANQILEELGFTVVYSDTDGTFVYRKGWDIVKILRNLDFLVEYVNDELKTRVIEKFNVPEEYYCLKLKVDDIYSKIFFGGVKKRYVGEVYDLSKDTALDDWRERALGGKLRRKVVGYEIVRLDVPPIVKIIQNKVFDIIFNYETEAEIKKQVRKLLRETKKLLFSGAFDEELVIEKGTRRKLESYKTEDVHIKVAKKLMEKGLFRPGDSVVYVITDVVNGELVGEPVIAGKIPEITPRGYRYYYDRILSMVERIIGERIDASSMTLDEWI